MVAHSSTGRGFTPSRSGPLWFARALLAGLLFGVSGCPSSTEGVADARIGDTECHPGDASELPEGRLVVATEQYGSGGGITVIDLASLVPKINVALTSDDVTPRWWGGRLWVLNRYGADNLTILDGEDFRLLRQVSLRPGVDAPCNPHDLALVSSCRAYLTCFDQPTLYVLDPTAEAGRVFIGEVDLSPMADDDGLPEASHLALVGDRLYVTLERLDRLTTWGPVAPSYVAVVDPSLEALEDTIALEGTNPVGPMKVVPGTVDLLVAVSGHWDGAAAGLELVSTETRSARTVLTASALGGIPTAFTVDGEGCGFALVTTPGTFESGVVRFCLGGEVVPCVPIGERAMSDLALTADGRLWVTDRDPRAPGVRVYDSGSCGEITLAPIPTGFAPGFTNPLLLIPGLE